MRFTIHTLIDITQTGARRGEDTYLYGQQQNFLTLLQTLSLRSNPISITKPVCAKTKLERYGFGTAYRGVHRVWNVMCEFEYEDQHSTELMLLDFDFVPIVAGLDETARPKAAALLTRDIEYKNIVFTQTL
jgi:hypothetical protein